MEVLRKSMLSIAQHVEKVAKELNEAQVSKFVECITSAKKIFVYGAGRSGLVARAFAMRLMHLGFKVYVIGETVTPAVENGDLLVTISGSGETTSVVNAAKTAKKAQAKIVLLTTYPESSLGKLADAVIAIEGRTKLAGEKDFVTRQMKGEHYSLAPLGTLFEVSALIFLDGLVVELMKRMKKSEEDLRTRHATIE